ncbi:class I SAM-dependent methyltransferase [Actinosynnema sp. NPDC053489]|uniref:class I SAM-dependent methyltransferase n=1 Tax=Actinosynnema sp. NPDC053489 TaxID=3363916 RepID=UPI0037CB211A
MTATEFDHTRFKEDQRLHWDAISAGWSSVADAFERGAGVVTARLLELGGVAAGDSVLDVGTGVGEPALTAAAAVGPAGRVVGVDLSPAMVELARRNGAGVANAEFLVGDVESLDLPRSGFDVVLARWSLMFAPEPAAAFRSLARVLKPGGVLAASTWGPPETAPMLSLGFRVLVTRLDLPAPAPGVPGPFGMADPEVPARHLAAAGFTDVSVTEVEVPFELPSPEAYARFTEAITPVAIRRRAREVLGADTSALWAEVAASTAPHRRPDGSVALPSKALCLRATAPSA